MVNSSPHKKSISKKVSRVSKGNSNSTSAPTLYKPKKAVQWEEISKVFERRSGFALYYGDTGTGRTTQALTAPGPIALIDCGEKIDGIIEPFRREKLIRRHNFSYSFSRREERKVLSKAAMEVWEGLEDAWYDAYTWARTVILDTETDAWELLRLAYFGDLKPSKGRTDYNYGPVNARFRSLFRFARMADNQNNVNTIVISKTQDEYVKGGKLDGMGIRTGNTIKTGHKNLEFFSDIVIRTCKQRLKGNTRYYSVLEKSWMSGTLEGLELEGKEECSFPYAMALITETDPEEWNINKHE